MKPSASTPCGSPGQPTLGSRAAFAPASMPTPRIASRQLFGEAVEIEIEHRTQIYRLRQTALGKLILTK